MVVTLGIDGGVRHIFHAPEGESDIFFMYLRGRGSTLFCKFDEVRINTSEIRKLELGTKQLNPYQLGMH